MNQVEKKNILVLYYTQSNQLEEILKKITLPISENISCNVTYYRYQMEDEFPFPWDGYSFFKCFKDSFLMNPQPIKKIPQEIFNQDYDLVILGYQVWYLSPSIPFNSLLKTKEISEFLHNKDIITISGTRNMWIMAHEKIKKTLKQLNGNIIGNIALTDRHINHISVITIVHWMFSGVKKKYLKIFPLPGVAQKEINESSKFGEVILDYLFGKTPKHQLQNKLLEKRAIEIRPFLILMDKTANKMFAKWANLIAKYPDKEKLLLKLFNYYLFFAIWFLSPIVYVLYLLFYPLKRKKYQKEKLYYSSVS